MSKERELLEAMFQAAVDAARPELCVPPHLPPQSAGRLIVVGAGKAAAAMARAVEERWQGDLSGVVVTRYGHGVACERIKVMEASHPIPDSNGERAARAILSAVEDAADHDLVLALISGGGSALLSLPAPGLTLEDKRTVTAALLTSGATIAEINGVRKHLSAIKGGRLAAAAWPAAVLTLAISDVPGDDPSLVASGPTVADPSTFAEARSVLEKYRITVPDAVRRRLDEAADETPKPGDPRFARNTFRFIATPRVSLEKAAACSASSGYQTVILGDDIEGEARIIGEHQARLALTSPPGRALISGGETTVTVKGTGRGGRNAEYLLAAAIALDGHPGIWGLAADTDGIDGSGDNAGAVLTPDSLARARALGLDPMKHLEENDAYAFFAALGDLVMTGPTRTNVNDFRVLLTGPHP